MVEQHHADGAVMGLVWPPHGDGLRQVEARHHIGDYYDGVSEDLADACLTVDDIRHRDDRVGVAVLNRLVRDVCVQQALDRRSRCDWIEARGREFAHHVGVRQRVEGEKVPQPRQIQRSEASAFDGREVPSRSLDEQRVERVACDVGKRGLDRCITASMEDQVRIGADEAGSVHALVEGALEASGRCLIPPVFHETLFLIERAVVADDGYQEPGTQGMI